MRGRHEAGSVAVLAQHATAEDLLDEDGDRQLARRREHGQDHREQQALAHPFDDHRL